MSERTQAQDRLQRQLASLRQGDLISLGGVAIVGAGPARAYTQTGADAPDDELWNVTIETDTGWYVVLSQDCDIVRPAAIEPVLVVSPIQLVAEPRWAGLRGGPYSPRMFPFPDDKGISGDAEGTPVADIRYMTCVDKTALDHLAVETLRPLTGPQRARFQRWLSRRFARAANDDMVERDVLTEAGGRIHSLAKSFVTAQDVTPAMRMVAAAEEWYLAGTDQLIELRPVISEGSARAAGLWDNNAGELRSDLIDQGAGQLQADLRKRLPAGGGFVMRVVPSTLDGVLASEYLTWSVWTLESPDPLAGGDPEGGP